MKKTKLILLLSFILLVAVLSFGVYRVAKAESFANNNQVNITNDVNFAQNSPMHIDSVVFTTGGEIKNYTYKSDYNRNGIVDNNSSFTVGMSGTSNTHITFGIKMERKTLFGATDTTYSDIGSHGGGSSTVTCRIGTGGNMQYVEFYSSHAAYAAPNARDYKRTLN